MPNYRHYVQNLTSLVITDTTVPSTDDIDIFLKDGQRNIASRLKLLDPASLPSITSTVEYDGGQWITGTEWDNSINDNDGSFNVPSGIVMLVEREDGYNGTYRIAHPINLQNRIDAENPGSIHYVTKYNPGFYMLNNKLFIVPAPVPSTIAGGGVDGEKIRLTYVAFDDLISGGSSYKPGQTSTDDLRPKGWNDKYRDLLIHYASIRCLRNKLTFLTMRDQDPELVPVLLETMNELKSYYEQGFLSPQSMQQQQQQQGGER